VLKGALAEVREWLKDPAKLAEIALRAEKEINNQ
jgi:hypothetical protein